MGRFQIKINRFKHLDILIRLNMKQIIVSNSRLIELTIFEKNLRGRGM